MFEVYALKYAERDTTACQFLYREASHAPLRCQWGSSKSSRQDSWPG